MSDKLVKPNELTNLESVQEVAQGMIDFIKQTKLSVPIQGKQYIQVDGWQFLSISFNLTPTITEIQNLSSDNELKYLAKCELTDKENNIISIGYGICSNKESKKRNFDEYAVLSMAQTRAIGKAYRNRFGFIAKLAGFEPTPHEEMDEIFNGNKNITKDKSALPLKAECYRILKSLNLEESTHNLWDEKIREANTEKQLIAIKDALNKLKK